MKIIGQNKFFKGAEHNILVCENTNGDYGQIIVNFLNENSNGLYYYKLLPNNYKFYKERKGK